MDIRLKWRQRRGWLAPLGLMLGAAALPALGVARLQAQYDSDDPTIQYAKTPANDAITHLQSEIDAGKVKLTFDPARGWLPSVLKALHIPVSSQMLVFSKTSFQHTLISPQQPRALYFDDATYIGWVQGGEVLEVLTIDPQLGSVFYLLPQKPATDPKFIRENDACLECHEGSMTRGVPGNIMRSVYARADGQPELRAGSYITTDQSPFNERWGGWYVTGTSGSQQHMGNVTAKGDDGVVTLDTDRGTNVTDLKPFLDTTPYLARTSDIVALMVVEHQTHVQNLITRANYETRIALKYERELNKELKRPLDYRSDSTTSRIKGVCEPLVRALLFSGEVPLSDPVVGTSGFTQYFSALGPKDSKGRSLRQLDLKRRLFRYPCSYLIYSPAFDSLPAPAKEYVYRRLREVLTDKDQSKEFAHLSSDDRKAILEILTETKLDFKTE